MAKTITRQKVGVTGHQVLPAAAIDFLRSKLEMWFVDAHETGVVCSLATGVDTLVAEFLMDRGASLSVVVPCDNYDSTFDAAESRRKYQALLARANDVQTLNFREPSEEAFMAAGIAVAELSDWLVAVWDGAPARGLGGTADVVAHARQIGRRVSVVWPEGLAR